MNRVELSRVNLNQLVALQVLLSTCSVSQAAKQLFVTQSAMSKTLANLRELFDDQILIRVGTRMQLTPLAEQLSRELPRLLQSIEDFVDLRVFDPKTADLELRIAVLPYLAQQLMPTFIAHMQEIAPGIKVTSENVSDKSWARLQQGELDLILGFPPRVGELPSAGEVLGTTRFATLVREGHPLTKTKVTLDEFLKYPHVRYLVPSMTRYRGGLVDEWLADRSLTRRVVFDTSELGSLMESLRKMECVYSGVDLQKLPGLNMQGVVEVDMPEGLEIPELKFWMYISPERRFSSETKWMAAELRKCYQSLMD